MLRHRHAWLVVAGLVLTAVARGNDALQLDPDLESAREDLKRLKKVTRPAG